MINITLLTAALKKCEAFQSAKAKLMRRISEAKKNRPKEQMTKKITQENIA